MVIASFKAQTTIIKMGWKNYDINFSASFETTLFLWKTWFESSGNQCICLFILYVKGDAIYVNVWVICHVIADCALAWPFEKIETFLIFIKSSVYAANYAKNM